MSKPTTNNQQPQIDADAIAACKTSLAVLAAIDPKGEGRNVTTPDGSVMEFNGLYRINRLGQSRVIKAADIELAAKVLADEKATLDDCRKALRPLRRLPVDSRVEDPKKIIYRFPGVGATHVDVSNGTIEAANRACGEED